MEIFMKGHDLMHDMIQIDDLHKQQNIFGRSVLCTMMRHHHLMDKPAINCVNETIKLLLLKLPFKTTNYYQHDVNES